MLILTLKEDDKILIGDKITVMLVEIRGNQIRLGIEAPAGLLVLREKLGEKQRHKGAPEGGSRRNPWCAARTPARPYPTAPPACHAAHAIAIALYG